MKNSENNNIILVLAFSFMYLVSVYPTNRTIILQKWSFCLERWKTKMSMFHVTTIEFPQRFENPGPVFNFGFMFVLVLQWGEISVWSRILNFMSLRFDEILKKHSSIWKISQIKLDILWIRRCKICFECEFRNHFPKFWVR